MAIMTRGAVKAFVAGEALEQYRLVRLSSASGTQVEYCDAEDTPIGVVDQDDPNLNTDSPVSIRMLTDSGTFKVVAAGAFSIGDLLYPAADGKVDDAIGDGSKACFIALEAATADNDVIEARPLYAGESGSTLLFANSAASTAHTNTTDAADFDVAATIQPEDIQIGDVLEVSALVNVTATNSTDTLTLLLKLGTETIATGAALDVADNDICLFHYFIRIQATGASGNIKAHGVTTYGVPGTAVPTPIIKAAAAEDLSAAFDIAVNADWSVADAGNSAQLEDLVVIRHRY